MFFDENELQDRIKELSRDSNKLQRKKNRSKNWTEFEEGVLSQTIRELKEAENDLINMNFPVNKDE